MMVSGWESKKEIVCMKRSADLSERVLNWPTSIHSTIQREDYTVMHYIGLVITIAIVKALSQ